MGSLADFSTKPRAKSVHSASSKCFMSSCLLARHRPTPSREERKSYLGPRVPWPELRTRPCCKGPPKRCWIPFSYRGSALNKTSPQVRLDILTLATQRTCGFEPPDHARDSSLAIHGVNTFVRDLPVPLGCDTML